MVMPILRYSFRVLVIVICWFFFLSLIWHVCTRSQKHFAIFSNQSIREWQNTTKSEITQFIASQQKKRRDLQLWSTSHLRLRSNQSSKQNDHLLPMSTFFALSHRSISDVDSKITFDGQNWTSSIKLSSATFVFVCVTFVKVIGRLLQKEADMC